MKLNNTDWQQLFKISGRNVLLLHLEMPGFESCVQNRGSRTELLPLPPAAVVS